MAKSTSCTLYLPFHLNSLLLSDLASFDVQLSTFDLFLIIKNLKKKFENLSTLQVEKDSHFFNFNGPTLSLPAGAGRVVGGLSANRRRPFCVGRRKNVN